VTLRLALIACLFVLCVSGCGANNHSAVVTVTVTRTTTPERVTRAAPVAHAQISFRLPSGNIACVMGRVVSCRVFSAGKRLFVLAPSGVARETTSRRPLASSSRVLTYGARRFFGPFVCKSAFVGLFCHARGHTRGMFLSRQRQLLDAAAPATTITRAGNAPSPTRRVGDKDFAVDDLQVKNDGLGNIGGIARLTNTSGQSLTVIFTFTFFQSGSIVGTAQGSANEVAPGQTITANLVSQDPMFSGSFKYQFQVDSEF
jgi:hypothetical protein